MATLASNLPNIGGSHGKRLGSASRQRTDGRAGSPRLSKHGPTTSVTGRIINGTPNPMADASLPPVENNKFGIIGPIPLRPKSKADVPLITNRLDVRFQLSEGTDVKQDLLAPGTAYLGSSINESDLTIMLSGGTLASHTAPAASGCHQWSLNDTEDDDQYIYPYPPAPLTNGPFRTPTISYPTKQQNARLVKLLALLNRANGAEGRDYAGGVRRRENEYSFAVEDSYVGFEKNLVDIQKLLERAKNIDEKAYNGASLVTSEGDKAGKRRKVDKPTAQQHHQPQLFDLLTENKTLAGRKPIRVIAAELEKRIETLKTNQAEWEAFQTKISEYRAADNDRARTIPADLIRQNKLAVAQMHPSQRRLMIQEGKELHDRHRADVRNRKMQQDMDLWKEHVLALRKKQDAVEHTKKKEKDQMGRAQALQKKWFILTAVASRMTIMRIVLETERKRRAELLVKVHAARVIQKAYRKYKQAQYERNKRLALAKIAVVFHKFIRRRREVQKHRASNTIRQFFRDVYDVSRLMKVVKKYRFSVVKAQHYVIGWHAIRNAQVDVICKYWEKLEPLWWSLRKVHGGGGTPLAGARKLGSSTELDDKKVKGKKGRTKARKDDNTDKVPLRIADNTKRAVILEDLIKRRYQHRKQLAQYVQDLGAFNASHKSGKGEPGPPRRPIFKLLPLQADMIALIEKGFLEATSSGFR
ncbi:uncharacterized protein SPPG_00614 [Spizellomyces punctatus DAOM BR117]|uniref:Uncharacterized protein n=1 Tax=Spizellomyces punctatus (strain DAOM BR117) TaxID=645134 RepID=A0A0L0HUX6_SPIPD|nr:uncharacterized protein SPPG_00614 [Spizellomyces punctatus DAOM BR117]KND04923.1 hypothetical protein SPPG_00614 [Spizellomyces punctatus DAOM BR117]|eukprot:XP_016612962.1 hypothetical protein SPPG_00614 [Spizellomyces punctatus DAOM BR117]